MPPEPTEQETGLRQAFLEKNAGWLAALRPMVDERDAIPLLVLVWGPGEGAGANFRKRMEIVEHIAKSSINNQAVTTEMLDEALPDLKASFPKVLDREEIHARKADIVFLMLLSPEQTGVQGEIVMISHDKTLKSKSWLFLPKRWPRESFLTQAVSDFPNEKKLQLTFPQIKECLRIRSFCDEKLAELRSEKQLEIIRFKAFKESLS